MGLYVDIRWALPGHIGIIGTQITLLTERRANYTLVSSAETRSEGPSLQPGFLFSFTLLCGVVKGGVRVQRERPRPQQLQPRDRPGALQEKRWCETSQKLREQYESSWEYVAGCLEGPAVRHPNG